MVKMHVFMFDIPITYHTFEEYDFQIEEDAMKAYTALLTVVKQLGYEVSTTSEWAGYKRHTLWKNEHRITVSLFTNV